MSLLLLRGRGGSADPLLQFLPSGMTLLSDESFTTPWSGTTPFNGWQVTEVFTYDQGGRAVTSPAWREDSSGGYGPAVARVECPQGSLGGVNFPQAGGTGFGGFNSAEVAAGNRRMYFAVRFRFSANYRIHNVDEKFIYPTYWGTSPSQVPLMGFRPAVVEPNPNGAGPARVTGIFYEQSSFYNEKTEPLVPMGEWNTMCYDWLLNTPEQNNGQCRVWLNGTLILENLTWRAYTGTNQLSFRTMRIASTRGGGPAAYPVPDGGMWRDYDRVVLYFGAQ